MLMTEHNLWFYQRLMQGLRDAIGEGRLAAYAGRLLSRYRQAVTNCLGAMNRQMFSSRRSVHGC